MPQPDPLENLRKLFMEGIRIILTIFPSLTVGIVTAFLAIILILLFLLQGVSISP